MLTQDRVTSHRRRDDDAKEIEIYGHSKATQVFGFRCEQAVGTIMILV